MNETDTLQAYFEQYAETTHLQWQIEDAADYAPWTAEWIYIFILAFALYLAAAAFIHNFKQRKKKQEESATQGDCRNCPYYVGYDNFCRYYNLHLAANGFEATCKNPNLNKKQDDNVPNTIHE